MNCRKRLRIAAGLFLAIVTIMVMTVVIHAESCDRSLIFDRFDYDHLEYRSYGARYAVFCGVDDLIGSTVIIPETVMENGNKRTVIGIINTNVHDDRLVDIYVPSTVKFVADMREGFYDPPISHYVRSIHFQDVPDLTIGKNAFYECPELITVAFNPNGRLTIDTHAFVRCPKLTRLSFSAGATIAEDAISECPNIRTIENAPGFLDLGGYAGVTFALDTVSFSPGVTEVEGITSDGSIPNLQNVTFPDGVISITGFSGCEKLTSVKLPEGLKKIDSGAFSECTGLTSINLPDSIEEIGEGAFYGCSSLSGIKRLPSSIQRIGEEAFMGCRNLKMSVNHVGSNCTDQYMNSGITDITIQTDLNTIINDECFTGCPNLSSITVTGSSLTNKSVDGVLYQKMTNIATGESYGWIMAKYPAAKSSGGRYDIPRDVSIIGGFAFEGCRFSEIHIPETVTELPGRYSYKTHEEYPPFSRMASNPTVYYVYNSYADISGQLYNCNAAGEYGPSVSISYDLDGGKNNASNPASFIAGKEVSLATPTRSGYDFVRWEQYSVDDEVWKTVNNNKLTPSLGQLVQGLKLRAKWIKKTPAPVKVLKKGATAKANGNTYKVTKAWTNKKNGTVSLIKANNVKTVTVPASVKLSDGKIYSVTSMGKECFKTSRATLVIIKTKNLTKKSVKNSLKSSKVSTIQVKVGNKNVNKTYVKKYKGFFTKKNAGRKVTVK